MAGFQSCLKNVVVINSFRIIRRNYVFQQFIRKNHLSFVISNLKKPEHYKKSKGFLHSELKNLCRYCSSSNIVKDQAEKNLNSADLNANQKIDHNNISLEGGTTAPGHSNIVIDETLLPPIPKAPGESDTTDVIASILDIVDTDLKEPTLASLGLGSWWPPGLIQLSLEFLHINLDLPWWGAIAVVTAVLKIGVLPLNIKARRNAINFQNNFPQIQHLQLKVSEARETGNYYEAAYHMQELHNFLKNNNIVTLGFFLPAIAQGPIFLSMFLALRKMSTLPVESMHTGGIFWVTDLTIPDPYYILPVFISGTLCLILESGAEGGSIQTITNVWMKFGLRVIPVLLLPFTINFPAALQVYWMISNCITLSQVLIFKIPAVQTWCKIPDAIQHDRKELPMGKKKKSGIEEIKDSLRSMKIIKEIQDRERLNTITFEKAGSGPIPRTFKLDPKKIQTN